MPMRALPERSGLYNPEAEHDSCGVGFVAHIKGQPSHQIITDADTILRRMSHRGACGCEANTGDGAGIMVGMPHEFFAKVAQTDLGLTLPEPGRYAVGNIFLPRGENERKACKGVLERYVQVQGQKLLGWREVPTRADDADLGPSARATEPVVEQIFIGAADNLDRTAFCRQLFLIRKQAYHAIRSLNFELLKDYYVCSLASRVIIYKGQLTPEQLLPYYPDLTDSDFTSHLAMVHSRFSTNTFPSWDRAQPMRFMSHNGEINTLRGNVNWMRAREGLMRNDLFGDEFRRLLPVIDPETSDSGIFDNVMELLLLSGRPLPEVVMMMIPEAWENHESMSPIKRAFYEFHSNLMEPWDGPASVAFTDGRYIGAVLDRNGLRPSRYYVTHDDRVIMASEVGVLDVEPTNVREKGRLQPGRMFLVDFEQGRIIPDQELKHEVASARPYGPWLRSQRIELGEIEEQPTPERYAEQELRAKMRCFGYTSEHMQMLLGPMASQAKEAIGSMGNDTALACLSDKPRMIYDYFKQLFAQVTNPPIDPIREEIIMSLSTRIGPEGNLLVTEEAQGHRIVLNQPILSNEQLAQLKQINHRGYHAKTIDITYRRTEGDGGLVGALDHICQQVSEAIHEGYSLVVLSDRAVAPDRMPISALLAMGAVHHHLVRSAERTKIGIVVETGEAREVHHMCLLIGYGADAVNPYLAFEALWQMRDDGVLDREMDDEAIVRNYTKALGKGILKVMSKMGISTLASYKGAQIFEAVGLMQDVVDRCFAGTASRLQGVDFAKLGEEAMRRHSLGYPSRDQIRIEGLENWGEYHWRAGGEQHMINPQSVSALQQAARTNSRQAYDQFAQTMNDHSKYLCTLRGLLKPRDAAMAVPLEEVEPAAEIVKRFRTGAMSLGSLSKEAHETLAVAMNRIGAKSNSGEGGEDYARFERLENGDWKRSAIKQVASGRFGVTAWYLANAQELQIKIAQGAKPGEGGQLPGHKVSQEIAKVRHSTPGVGLISPPPHHDIYSIEDLAQLIFDLKNANPDANVSVKLVSEFGVGTVAAGVAKAHADHILISGHDGGTGASPLTSIKHAGLPWELGIAETHQTLVLNDLRSRVRLETDGQLKTGRDLVIAAALGAEEYGFSTAPLITLGCIMMRKCHLNTCPVGIATQDPTLRAKFAGQPEHVINYLFMVAEDARQWMAKMGVRSLDELVGRVDLLETDAAVNHWKADGLDLTPLLTPATKPRPDVKVRKCIAQDHGIDDALDHELVRLAEPAINDDKPVRIEMPIGNVNRCVGGILSYRISQKRGVAALPDDSIHIKFTGSSGQSFGTWLVRGVTMELEGDANDYVGKGLSGGKLIIYPHKDANFVPEDNIIIGNVALYGATEGMLFVRGMAAERFAVRNSGVIACIEGMGDHGCEYMTGGRVVVLGPTGRNFAAGMSGGIAYVLDTDNDFLTRCNLEMVDLEKVDSEEDQAELRSIIESHQAYTGSTVAQSILEDWDNQVSRFVKVMPTDYKRVLLEQTQQPTDVQNQVHVDVADPSHPPQPA